MNLPSDRECFKIIRKMKMMDHIIDHSVMVSNVAVCLGGHLKQSTPGLNLDLVRTAALLHDITKTRSFETGEMHSETGGGLAVSLGYPEIGDIIRQHVILDKRTDKGPVSEPELVNYADKRVLHDQVVSLDQRLAYIKVKYGTIPEFRKRIRRMWEDTLALEVKIFRSIGFTPEELPGRVTLCVHKITQDRESASDLKDENPVDYPADSPTT
ncbi:MAG TPA: metal-dependent phosphohydrolase [Desulfobacteraceae bacterium]|nr:metal-dependent phosphohydrolase [Desulfobacteraceae bacterium]|tara:strand:- start:270 stop:905 length:636 start_codon:yes stop_codon:yes gene_type:complete